MNTYEITPVEKHNGIYYKRDDLYAPYGDVNGGKVRQTIEIIENCSVGAKGIIASTSVHSPSSTIFSRVAQEYNIPCIIAVGGTKPENLDKLPMMRLCKHFGAEIRIVAGHGMKTAISARIKEIQQENGYYNPDFSKHIHTHPELMFVNAEQAINIPNELDVLIAPVGSGIQFANILKGIHKYNKSVKRIIGVQVGPDRRKLIDSYLYKELVWEEKTIYVYELMQYEIQFPHSYSKSEKQIVSEGTTPEFELDDLYEAKAHKWMLNNIVSDKVLFWCVGRRFFDGMESIFAV
jgi:1-aminocyclopropane-1-carboxylate deaminase/D-cysteine desulfhydrase-like pyridoxal-dependent ACC family enzyme